METTLQVITLEPSRTATMSVIWLHGLGADGHDFEPIVPELRLPPNHGIRFLFPHAPIRPVTINDGMEMRAWYDVMGLGLDREVDERGIRDSAALVQTLVEQEIAAGIESTNIVLAGFSQGGVIALHLGLRFAHKLGGILALSTYLALTNTLAVEAAVAQKHTRIFVAHGTHDPLIPESFGQEASAFLEKAGYPVEYKAYAMEHAVCAEEILDIAAWFKKVLL